MRNAGLDEAQVGIKNAGRNINNLRYAEDTTLMAESEEGLKSLLMKVNEDSEKAGLKLNIQETKIMVAKSNLQPSKKALSRTQLYCILILGFSLQNDVQLISLQAAATGAYPRRRGANPPPRSGAEARRIPCLKGGGQEELPHVRGQGQRRRVPDCDSAGTAEGSYPVSDIRVGGKEEIPSV